MAKLFIYCLHFSSPLHLGDERDDYSISLKTVHSDSFYAALTSCNAKYGKDIPDDGDLGFNISSLFPFYQKDEQSRPQLFFPKSLWQDELVPEFFNHRKAIKNIKWLDKFYFQKQLEGKKLIQSSSDLENIHGEYLSEFKLDSDFILSKISQRVTIERTGEKQASPFYMDRISFADNSGLFFIASGDTSILEISLEYLQYEGIGTDRNVGNGFFTFSKNEIELDLVSSNYKMNLSLFCPSDEPSLAVHLNSSFCAYDLVRRGGWITTPPYNTIRKNSIYAFREGSVFKSDGVKDITVNGKIVDLKPNLEFDPIDHPIWRNLKAIFLPIIIKSES